MQTNTKQNLIIRKYVHKIVKNLFRPLWFKKQKQKDDIWKQRLFHIVILITKIKKIDIAYKLDIILSCFVHQDYWWFS